jgi:hypothetical protein
MPGKAATSLTDKARPAVEPEYLPPTVLKLASTRVKERGHFSSLSPRKNAVHDPRQAKGTAARKPTRADAISEIEGQIITVTRTLFFRRFLTSSSILLIFHEHGTAIRAILLAVAIPTTYPPQPDIAW